MERKDKIKFINAFNQLSNLGPKNFAKIEAHFANFREAWQAPIIKFRQAGIKGEKTLKKIKERKKNVAPAEELKRLKEENVQVVLKEDKSYPEKLKEIASPPYILYLKGEKSVLRGQNIAVVGTRSYTSYGKEAAFYLTKKLVYQNFGVVSGLAKGIDSFSHRTCLDEGGRTVAVLANGLERVYPRANEGLAQDIIDGDGALISENPLGVNVRRYHFPQRNRIISGLSWGVLVVEAGKKSGALITANQALEQNREVFSVPGDIFSGASKGTNKLIKQGATPVSCVDDIVENFNLEKEETKEKESIVGENPKEKKIIEALKNGSLSREKIITKTDLSSEKVSSTLTILTMKGKLKELGGGVYALKR